MSKDNFYNNRNKLLSGYNKSEVNTLSPLSHQIPIPTLLIKVANCDWKAIAHTPEDSAQGERRAENVLSVRSTTGGLDTENSKQRLKQFELVAQIGLDTCSSPCKAQALSTGRSMTQDMLVLAFSSDVLSSVKSYSAGTATSKIGRLSQSERLRGSIWLSTPRDRLIFTKSLSFSLKPLVKERTR